MAQANNKQIAKNTLFLYLRMLLTTAVSLYTGRVVLNTLGVEDFGTYGLVGGVVAMFSFLNMAAGGATTRFLTYEMGRGEQGRLKDMFSTAFIVHAIIAIIVALLVGTIGLWFLWNKLVIPDGRMEAATIVLVCSVISMAINVTQEPYNADLIAHEKFDVYAYVEFLNVGLKLLIVYLLTIGDFDKLIFYAFLQLGVSLTIALIYRVYCIRHFEESRLHWIWDKALLKPMISYSGWDLFGTVSLTTKTQGTAFLINMFFGVVFNAASSVAATVEGTIAGLSTNMLAAFRPQIVKQYSSGNAEGSARLVYQGAKFASILLVLLAIPFICEMDFIMTLWLKNPPEYAAVFCRIMFISGIINMSSCAVFFGIGAYGKMGTVSILSSVANFSQLFILWLCFYLGARVESAYLLGIAFTMVSLSIRALALQKYIPQFRYSTLLSSVYLPLSGIAIVTVLSVLPSMILMPDGFLRCFIVFAIDGLVGCAATYLIALNKLQRQQVFAFVKSKLHR